MSFSLVLNSSNVVGNNNNTFQYKFINGNFRIPEGSEITISNIVIPYSFYNVASYYNNQSFSFTFPNTATNTYNLTLTAGFYAVTDINAYIQQYCIANSLYLIDGSGNNVYYINLSYNTNFYKIQLLCFAVPTALPSGYSAPAGWAGYPVAATTPTFTVLNNNFGNLIGFTAGTYPTVAQATSYSALSSITPVGTIVNSLIIRCTIVDNPVSQPSDILDSMPIASSFGTNLTYSPSYEKWVRLKGGIYNSFQITFTDQNGGILYALDPNVIITLMVRFPKQIQ